MPQRLTGPQLRELRSILRTLFTLAEIDLLLFDHLGRRREDYALGSSAEEVLATLIDKANRSGWPAEFVRAAIAENPDPALQSFSHEYFA